MSCGAITGGGGSVNLRKGLVIAQVAFSFLLLAGAGLFVKTLANLKHTNPGFKDIDRLVTLQVDAALNGYSSPRLHAFYNLVLDNLRAVPGVNAAGFAFVPVLSGDEWDSTMSVEGHTASDGEDLQAFMNGISPDYWKTMGLTLVEGRDFDQRDSGQGCSKLLIVNRAFTTHYFGHRSPIGRHIGFGGGPKTKLNIEIIGVAADSLYEGPRAGVHRQVFIPFDQFDYPGSVSFYVRTSSDPNQTFASLRRKIAELDPAIPVYQMNTLDRQLDDTLSTERLIALLSGAFGILATLLAAMGLYGVMAFVVARRTKEIWTALIRTGGAARRVIWMQTMKETLALLGLGLLVGVPCAYFLSRYVTSQLFNVTPTDLRTALSALA